MKINRLKLFFLTFALVTTNLSVVKTNAYAKGIPYFEKKANSEDTTIDDLILTLEERGLYLDDYSSYQIQRLSEQLVESQATMGLRTIAIDSLNVEKYFYQTFLSDNIAHEVKKHTYITLYNSSKNDIYWDKLFNIVKENNKKYAEEIEEIEKDYFNKPYEELTDEDLKLVLLYIKDFIIEIKKDKPDLDMKNLACKLNELVIGYELDYENENTLATTLYSTILFPLYDGCYPNLEMMREIVNHEVKHLINFSCVDERIEPFPLAASGVSIDNYWLEYSPFSWSFIEEAYAEKYSAELIEKEPFTYESERYIVDTLEMVNCFYGNEAGTLCKYGIEHNPIALLQQFLVLGETDLDRQLWLVQNATMLEGYEVLSDPFYYMYNLENNYGIVATWNVEDESENKSVIPNYGYNEVLLDVMDEANIQLLRLGLAGIVCRVENNENKLTLDDCIYLAKLLDYRIEQYSIKTQESMGLKDSHGKYYLTEQEKLLNNFKQYLEVEFFEYNESSFDNLNIEDYILSTAFKSEDIWYYYNLCEELTLNDEKKKDEKFAQLYKKPGEK